MYYYYVLLLCTITLLLCTVTMYYYYYMYLPLYYHVGVFILRARRPKHESLSLRQVFWLRASKIKTSTQQRVQTERRVMTSKTNLEVQ